MRNDNDTWIKKLLLTHNSLTFSILRLWISLSRENILYDMRNYRSQRLQVYVRVTFLSRFSLIMLRNCITDGAIKFANESLPKSLCQIIFSSVFTRMTETYQNYITWANTFVRVNCHLCQCFHCQIIFVANQTGLILSKGLLACA